ncbi:NUMOD4 motif-containing HNH endonuclease [Paracoccus denitrificans]|uniref:NUMOD4 domain-containing protein n=1 Tax=Paracoccus denitrificans TaxID=266 RepID=UPI001E332C9D|nr:NUMOD4 domain-containing protein [Paracoccus denitrificans]UFS65295.1 NUMOD4 motif-containing HNH endonuclease [Paracoccus denitrificans]
MNAPVRMPLVHVDAAACRKLWVAVLAEMWNVALFDGLGAIPAGVGEVAAADRWFGSRDFRMVCALAGLDDDKVLEAYRSAKTGDARPAGIFARKNRVPPRALPVSGVPEVWREVKGFPAYDVSNLGRVRSWLRRGVNSERIIDRQRAPRILRGENGIEIRLCDLEGGFHSRRIHLLVLEAFVGPAPRGASPVWLDGNRRNNTTGNLAWSVSREVAA